MFAGHQVDFCFKVGDFSIVVFICYQGREFPFLSSELEGKKCGVIKVELAEMPNLFKVAKKQEISYIEALKNYLAIDVEGKEWFYHPRYSKSFYSAKEQAKAEAENQIKSQQNLQNYSTSRNTNYDSRAVHSNKPKSRTTQKTIVKAASVEYKPINCTCVSCGFSWKGTTPGVNVCHFCKTHLYVRTD